MTTLALHEPAVKPTRSRRPAASSLGMWIGRTHYRVSAVRPDPGAGVLRAFRLSKADGTAYDAHADAHGTHCTCPDFVFRRDGRDPAGCKHVRALVAAGLLPGIAAAPEAPDARRAAAQAPCFEALIECDGKTLPLPGPTLDAACRAACAWIGYFAPSQDETVIIRGADSGRALAVLRWNAEEKMWHRHSAMH